MQWYLSLTVPSCTCLPELHALAARNAIATRLWHFIEHPATYARTWIELLKSTRFEKVNSVRLTDDTSRFSVASYMQNACVLSGFAPQLLKHVAAVVLTSCHAARSVWASVWCSRASW
jgi:hypothetical protein